MPIVPPSNINTTDASQSVMQQPSATSLLMAAAEMHRQGRLVEPQRQAPNEPSLPAGRPSGRPHNPARRLKVVK